MPTSSDRRSGRMLGRREVLGSGAALALGAMTFGSARAAVAPDDASTVKRYRALGSTGIEVPDISFGTGTTADPSENESS